MGPNGLPLYLEAVVPPLTGFLVLFCIALISLLRGRGRQVNLLFAAICLLGALLNADVAVVSLLPDEGLALRIDRLIHLVFVFSVPVYIRFVHTFLGIQGRRWLEITALAFSALLAIIVPTDLYFSGFHHFPFGRIARAGPFFPLFEGAVIFTVVYSLALLYAALKGATDNRRRNRIKYILGGFGGLTSLMAFTILPVNGIPVYPLGNFSFIPSVILAVGILKYDLLDVGALIRRGTFYVLLTGTLTIIYALVLFLFHALFLNAGGGNPLILSLLLALLIVILFQPIKEGLQRLIDRLFFRGRYDYRLLLREISAELAGLLNLVQIRELLVNAITAALQVEGVGLVIADGQGFRLYRGGEEEAEGEPLADRLTACIDLFAERPLSRAEIGDHGDGAPTGDDALLPLFDFLSAALIVPLHAGKGVTGLIAIGQKRSGELFVDEDLELLTTMANQATTAIANAQSYEALVDLNRQLEQKVASRTASLKEALAEKERTQARLVRSESLAAIGQLVAGTAHELNNPIAAAMSLVESGITTLGNPRATPEDREELLDDLRFSLTELRRAGAVIRSLLDLSRQTQTYLEEVDMNRVCDDALQVLFNQYKKLPVVIEKDYDSGLPVVTGNFANLGQVMINIIRNALEALQGEQGRIWIKTRRMAGQEGIVVVCRDTGVGIPPLVLKDIFKPFFTTKAVGQGTGLGLYLCHEIVRRHGGQILMESEEGRGTTVTVEIPGRREEP